MYARGQGMPQDYQEAAKWCRLAADQGYAVAQYDLGMMYVAGNGVPQNYILAHMWLNLTAAQGTEKAIKDRNTLGEKLMTPDQLVEAQRLAREWKAKGK